MNKRRSMILALLLVASMLLSACGPVATEYLKEVEKVQEWAGIEANYDADVKITITAEDEEGNEEPVEIDLPIKITAMTKGEDQGHIVMDMSKAMDDFKADLSEEELKEIEFVDEPINVYVDGTDTYFSKNYFEMMAPGEFADIEEDYIKIDSGNEELDIADLTEASEKLSDLITNYEGKKDMTKEGNTFSFSYNAEELAAEAEGALEFVKENQDELIAALKPFFEYTSVMSVSDQSEMVKELLADIDLDEVKEGLDEVVEELEGTEFKGTTTFEEDLVTQDVEMKIVLGDFMTMEYKVTGTSKKLDEVDIAFPESYKVLTTEELSEMILTLPEDFQRVVLVFIDDELLESDVDPFLEEGRTLVPIRAIMETLDAEVEWDEETEKVTITEDDTVIELEIGSNKALVDGEEVELDVAAKLVDKRTFVPLRFISENLGYDVGYEMTDFAHEVYINTK